MLHEETAPANRHKTLKSYQLLQKPGACPPPRPLHASLVPAWLPRSWRRGMPFPAGFPTAPQHTRQLSPPCRPGLTLPLCLGAVTPADGAAPRFPSLGFRVNSAQGEASCQRGNQIQAEMEGGAELPHSLPLTPGQHQHSEPQGPGLWVPAEGCEAVARPSRAASNPPLNSARPRSVLLSVL